MTDREAAADQFDRDDELRALLRRSDPARLLPPADPTGLAALLAQTAGTDLGRPDQRAPEGPRRRGPLTWLVGAAAAAVVVTAGVGAVHQMTRGDDAGTRTAAAQSPAPSPSRSPVSTGTPDAQAPVRTLTVSPAAFEARCAAPNATMLAATDTAFSGKVTAIDGRTVTVATGAVLQGAVAPTVTVKAPPAELGRLVQSVHFKVGDTYLIAASDGQLALCGFSGPARPALQGIYTEAFPR